MLRFFIALWASKFAMWVYKLLGRERDDRPGLLAYKLCPRFLQYIAKPKLVIAITGTNGKTTTSALINNKLVADGYRVSFNDWGANLQAGFGLNLMRCVTIFNHPTKKDVAVLEADEKTLDETMTLIEPDYILVTNICKDSLRRNGHPEYIFDQVERTFNILGDRTVAILNANDPISSQLARNSGTRRVFYGMEDVGETPFENMSKDIAVCPRCGGPIRYHYRLYRHIGGFYCEDCDFDTPEMQYKVERLDLDRREMIVREPRISEQKPTPAGVSGPSEQKTTPPGVSGPSEQKPTPAGASGPSEQKTPPAASSATAPDASPAAQAGAQSIPAARTAEVSAYPLISDTVFNAFNVLSFVALMRELGQTPEELAAFIRTQQVTKIRESSVTFNGIEYLTYAAKSQNVSAASTVFEFMAKEPSIKELVLLLDEVQDRNHPSETLTWLYETDFEFLNSPNIRKIIVGGHMFLNHKLRLLLAGIDPAKIVCVEDEAEIVDHVDTEGIEKVYVLFEIDYVTKARNMRDRIVARAKEVAAR